MNKLLISILLAALIPTAWLSAQSTEPTHRQRQDLTALIDQYSQARENRDTVLLKEILANDIDQLVSTGEWRYGIRSAIGGMMASSANAPGTRRLSVEKIRILTPGSALVDCRYEIENPDGTMRKMWSSFVAVTVKGRWKISAIRNMLPSER